MKGKQVFRSITFKEPCDALGDPGAGSDLGRQVVCIFTLTFDDAVTHVDTGVLFRQMAREIAWDHGNLLTFLPKPHLNNGGNGMHINFSLLENNGHNAITKDERGDPDILSDLAHGCIAGWMRHHKAMAGLIAPNALHYAPFVPDQGDRRAERNSFEHPGLMIR